MERKEGFLIVEEILKMLVSPKTHFQENMKEYVCDKLDISDSSLDEVLSIISSENGVELIVLGPSNIENQKNIIEDIGIEPIEAEIISNTIRELVEYKINKTKNDWPQDVKDAFVNLMTSIMLQEIKLGKDRMNKLASNLKNSEK